MAVFANEWPNDFDAGSDFVQIEDDEFTLVSEPQGLIAIMPDNAQGYLTLPAAKRLFAMLPQAIANSEALPPEFETSAAPSGRSDDDMPF